MRLSTCWAIMLWAGLALAGSTAESYTDDPGDYRVTVLLGDWQDSTRDRTVPAKIYLPAAEQAVPVIIFSHGLGGSRDGYEYLGRYWASHGYASVHLQHPGSDEAVWKDQARPMLAMKQAAATIRNSIDRPRDVSFAIDQLEAMNKEGKLAGRLDLDRLGVAGHSFGAFTTLAVAGQRFSVMGKEVSFEDKRVKAAIAMSAPVPAKGEDNLRVAFGRIAIPVFHLTGTEDDAQIGNTSVEERRLPFDYSGELADALLLVFTGGDHMVFSGRQPRSRRQQQTYATMQQLIKVGSLAFWDAYLRGDAQAKAWLLQDGYTQRIGAAGTLELKNPEP